MGSFQPNEIVHKNGSQSCIQGSEKNMCSQRVALLALLALSFPSPMSVMAGNIP